VLFFFLLDTFTKQHRQSCWRQPWSSDSDYILLKDLRRQNLHL